MASLDSFSNQFLVALSTLSGDCQKTLTLLIDHSDKGAFGMVVNSATGAQSSMFSRTYRQISSAPLRRQAGGAG